MGDNDNATPKTTAARIIPLIDHTSLNTNDDEKTIRALLNGIRPDLGTPAAVCVFPQFIPLVKTLLKEKQFESVKIATPTNFPTGTLLLPEVLEQTRYAIENGADEIDLVMPYHHIIQSDNLDIPRQYVRESKRLCDKTNVKLKVIIESGALRSEDLIVKATSVAISAGADFVKTSTGTAEINATLSAAKVMLETIKNTKSSVGLKISGGIKTLKDAMEYLRLCESIMGEEWVKNDRFRFGASRLLSDVYEQMQ